MPHLSKKDKILRELYLLLQEQRTLEAVGPDAAIVDENIAELLDAIDEVGRCRYGSIEPVPKSFGYLLDVLPNLDEVRYKKKLVLSKDELNFIARELKTTSVFSEPDPQAFPVELQFCVFLNRFASTCLSFANQAACFALGDGSTITRYTENIVVALLELQAKYIYWPDQAEKDEMFAHSVRRGIPGVMFWIDGTHIIFDKAPSWNKSEYCDRHGKYSIQLQLICDDNKFIRNVFTGMVGSTHDSTALSRSHIGQNIGSYLQAHEKIGGDKGYPLRKNLITPFKENSADIRNLAIPARVVEEFNTKFSSHRVKIEHCNGILKESFKGLKRLNIKIAGDEGHIRVCQAVTATCVLYNIFRQIRGDDLDRIYVEDQHENHPDYVEPQGIDMQDLEDGQNERLEICKIMFPRFF